MQHCGYRNQLSRVYLFEAVSEHNLHGDALKTCQPDCSGYWRLAEIGATVCRAITIWAMGW